jgi:transcriptional regulator with XRE-family HTH domain
VSGKKDDFTYPGDEAVLKAVGETLKEARLAQGMSLEEAGARFKEAERKTDYQTARRAVAIAIRAFREEKGLTRRQLSKASGVPMRRIILVERAVMNIPFTDFVRISYAMKVKPHVVAEKVEEIEKNLLADKGKR